MKKIIWLVLIFAVMITACSNQSAGIGSVHPSESTAEPSSEEITVENGEKIFAYLCSEECIDWNTGISKLSDIAKNFPLGYSSDGNQGRGIFTFRRNPDDFSYIIVYFEFDGGCSWKEVFDDDKMYVCDGASYNYKIGFLDSEGRLLESYDTGFPVLASPFGFYSVQMRYSEEKLLLFFDNSGKGEGHFEGEFDMKTKEFTVL